MFGIWMALRKLYVQQKQETKHNNVKYLPQARLLGTDGFPCCSSHVLHHAGAQDAGSQPKESQIVHKDLEWILEDSEDPAVSDQVREGASVNFLWLAAHQLLQMLSTALLASCYPSLLKDRGYPMNQL